VQKIHEATAKMAAHFRVCQTEHTPLPQLTTAISDGIFRIFSAEFALPTGMLKMHGIMVANLADLIWT
jgi:hypothetical protein